MYGTFITFFHSGTGKVYVCSQSSTWTCVRSFRTTKLSLVSGGQIPTNFPTIFLPSLGQFHCFCFLLFSREEYKTMKWQWQSMTKTQENNFSEFRERKHLVGKEVQNVTGTLQHLNFLVHVASIYLLQKDTDEANIL